MSLQQNVPPRPPVTPNHSSTSPLDSGASVTEQPSASSSESISLPPPPSTSSETPSDAKPQPEAHDSPSEKPLRSAPVLDVEDVKERLRSLSEIAAARIRDKADNYTALAATTFAQLGRELNKVTGYGEIESLKRQVVEQGTLSRSMNSVHLPHESSTLR